jgi:hypothetical protein
VAVFTKVHLQLSGDPGVSSLAVPYSGLKHWTNTLSTLKKVEDECRILSQLLEYFVSIFLCISTVANMWFGYHVAYQKGHGKVPRQESDFGEGSAFWRSCYRIPVLLQI